MKWGGYQREEYGSAGSGQDQFQLIQAMTMDGDGYLHIIDNYTNWIKVKFGGEGWDKIDINPEGFAYVRDIFYSADTGYFYLTDYSTDEIVECDRAFTHDVRMDYGWENMTAAVYSATGYQGEPRVVFCETDSDYVCATTLDVTDRDYIGASWAPHAGELSSPSGIAEYDGHFYVSDAGNDRIVRFEMSGAGWATYLTSGSGSQQCALPRRIQIDSNTGNLYFLDYFNKRIGKFSTENFN
jgi:DNA-binding beta-propeller fold protein YncE